MIELKIIMFVFFEAQAGFRKGMGTTDNIFFILHGLISHCINNNNKLYAAFVDFQKACGCGAGLHAQF